MNNGPVTAYHEIQYSPYHMHVNKTGRTFTFFLTESVTDQTGTCRDETQYFARCRLEGNLIDMPQMQGAIYIENCHDLETCFRVEDWEEDFNYLYELNKEKLTLKKF